MMKLVTIFTLFTCSCLLLSGCSGSKSDAPIEPEFTIHEELENLKGMKIRQEGWEKDYGKTLDMWLVQEKGYDEHAFYVQKINESHPKNIKEFAERLHEKDFLDQGYQWSSIQQMESFEDGWAILGKIRDYAAQTEENSFVVYLAKYGVLCKCSAANSAEIASKMAELCKTISF